MAEVPEEAMDALVYNYLQDKDPKIAQVFKAKTQPVSYLCVIGLNYLLNWIVGKSTCHHVGLHAHVVWATMFPTRLQFLELLKWQLLITSISANIVERISIS